MKWFKLFSEARNDAKLGSLSDAQHRAWFNLLCLASEQPERGTIRGFTLHHLAIEVYRDTGVLLDTLNALQALHSVSWHQNDDQTLEIVFNSFAKRQHRKPSDHPDRVRDRVARSREAKRSINGKKPRKGNTRVTPRVTPRNAPETPGNAYKELELEDDLTIGAPAPLSPESSDPSSNPAYLEAISTVRVVLGNDAAKRVGRGRASIDLRLSGKWECVTASARKVELDLQRPNAPTIHDPVAMVLKIAFAYAVEGIPEPPRPRIRTFHDGSPALPTNVLRAPSRDRANDQHPTEVLG